MYARAAAGKWTLTVSLLVEIERFHTSIVSSTNNRTVGASNFISHCSTRKRHVLYIIICVPRFVTLVLKGLRECCHIKGLNIDCAICHVTANNMFAGLLQPTDALDDSNM